MASRKSVVAESIDGVAECLSTDRAVLDRVVGELDALRLPVINHRHPSVRVKHFIAKERGGVATEENVQAAHVLREEARLVQRKAEQRWAGTLTVGVTYLPNMNPDRHDLYMDIQDHPSTASRMTRSRHYQRRWPCSRLHWPPPPRRQRPQRRSRLWSPL